jgi:Ca2+-dependent lipid-binding protein
MQFCATKLENKDNFSKSDPYYTISKTMGPGHWSEVARSNYIKDTLNPSWPAVTIPVSELCNGDYEKQIKFSVFDHDDMGNNDMVRRNNVAHAMRKERTSSSNSGKRLGFGLTFQKSSVSLGTFPVIGGPEMPVMDLQRSFWFH